MPELDSFCGKCGDRMAAGWREEPFCPTCEFPRAAATAPPGEKERAEIARLRAVVFAIIDSDGDVQTLKDIARAALVPGEVVA